MIGRFEVELQALDLASAQRLLLVLWRTARDRPSLKRAVKSKRCATGLPVACPA
jgi:hypothetical protein